ncbi:LysR family transcriptional regulator [[Ruminococcus] gnavus]|nr:LysR family transcriptional regulator [Mediterraneibacter gnavus]NSI41359.1 LysR family transcriptional regulator [Mediterraneibacter gnavus]
MNFLQTQDFKKEQLCISQPSLSHAIAQLEKELGIPLFEKTEEIQP